MSMIYGTAYFPSERAAIKYFMPYSFDNYAFTRADVLRRLIDKEIHIGKPETKRGAVVLIDGGTRYGIAE